jgi:hypothetical protein
MTDRAALRQEILRLTRLTLFIHNDSVAGNLLADQK